MKKHLNYGVSAVALGLLFAHPAAAFDNVDWSWTSTINHTVDINIDIKADNSFYPTGLTQVEQLQVSAGSMVAASNQNGTQFNVNNGAPGGPVVVDLGKLTVTDTVGLLGASGVVTAQQDPGGAVITPVQTNFSSSYNPLGTTAVNTIDLGTIVVQTPGVGVANLDALVDLGRLEGNATAAGNVASVSSEVATYFHDGQIAFGGFDQIDNLGDVLQALGAGVSTALVLPTGNRNMDALATAAIAAQFGLIQQGTIDATATATNVLNAQVALNSTGAGNLHSVTVGPRYTPVLKTGSTSDLWTDNIVIGDLNQFNLMNVTATADASGLQINGYKNLGLLKDQYGTWTAASSVNASAFGNMSSVTNRVNGLAPLPYVK